MLSAKLQDALNQQINEEFFSSYLYLAMAAYLDDLNLDGCAHWMRMQAQEEHLHAMKIFDYVAERGGRVVLKAIAEPQKAWKSVLEVFEASLEHEQHITKCIAELADLAIQEKDHPTNNLMQWFVNEQVEEEATVDAIVNKMKLMGDHGLGLFMMDNELAARPMPTLPAEGEA